MFGNLGFVASVLSEGLSTSRTCRLRNATAQRIRELTRDNLDALASVLTFLERHDVHLYRISSNLIPFASHPVNEVCWWEEFAERLSQLGRRIGELDVRVSTHPGQYTVLNSPHSGVVHAAVEELTFHARLLDALGTAVSSKIVVHVGGLYGGTERQAMSRFVDVARGLPDTVRRRLVIENDDRLFDADEVLHISRALQIPVVFDWLHHRANPCRRPIDEVLEEVFATWTAADGRPKVHLSSQAAGASPGAHAEFVDPHDAVEFLQRAPAQTFDAMLEAKQKDRALLRLRQELAGLGILETGRRQPAPTRSRRRR